MRVLISTNMYPHDQRPWYGIFVQQQEESLRRLGVEVDISAHLGCLSRWNYARGLVDLVRQLRARPYDLIHSHHPYSTLLAWLARGIAGKTGVPLIQTFHDSEIYRRDTHFEQDFLRRLKYSLRIKAWALRRCDYLIPVQRDMLPTVFGDDADRIPFRIIPAGVDMDRFQPCDRDKARQRLGLDPDRLYVFFPCDPEKPEKRFDLARAGFDLFARDHPQAELIVGGSIPYAQMPDYMNAMDILLTPTDYETGPLVVREAMACEKPVVSTDVGDVRECYGDLPSLFLCDWAAEDVAARLRQAAQFKGPFRGRDRLQERGIGLDQVGARVLEVYQALLGQRS